MNELSCLYVYVFLYWYILCLHFAPWQMMPFRDVEPVKSINFHGVERLLLFFWSQEELHQSLLEENPQTLDQHFEVGHFFGFHQNSTALFTLYQGENGQWLQKTF